MANKKIKKIGVQKQKQTRKKVQVPSKVKESKIFEQTDSNTEIVSTKSIIIRVRSNPDNLAPVLGSFPTGKRFVVVSPENNGWVEVQTIEEPTIRGYVKSVYVKKVK